MPKRKQSAIACSLPGDSAAAAFHSIAGILSGLRMNILAAQVCTTSNGVVIAYFRVTDNDFTGPRTA
jgi:UTP:GlnB (protein PII) uridylyltransferase